jgi:hypothetical protein
MTHEKNLSRRRAQTAISLEPLEGRQLMTASYWYFNNPLTVVAASAGSASIQLSYESVNDLGAAPTTAQQLYLSIGGGDATPGVDYTPAIQVVNFAGGQNFQNVKVPILPGTASEGTTYVELDLATTPGGKPVANAYLEITHNSDTTPPTVVGSKVLTHGSYITGFVITFSKPMAPGPVSDVSNYAIDDPRSMKMNKRIHQQYASRTIPLKSAVYDPNTYSVTLLTAGKVKKYPVFSIDGSQSDAMNNNDIKNATNEAAIQSAQSFNTISPITDTTGNLLGDSGTGTSDGALGVEVAVGKLGQALQEFS